MNLNNYLAKIFAFTVMLATVFAASSSPVSAAKGKRSQPKQVKLWQQIDESSLRSGGERSALPDKVPVYRLNRTMLSDILDNAPLEFTSSARQTEVVLEIPTPEGKLVRFRIEESPMLSAEVAAQFPTWKTFSGQGIDDKTAIARFDTNANGFHGYVSGANGTFLIDPYSLTDQKNYIVYYKGDLGGNPQAFSCKVSGGKSDGADWSFLSAPQAFSNGTQLRNYRLAVSATASYTNFFAGSQTNAFAAIQTTVNRIILIYRRELATTFTLVSTTKTVFTNTNTGGFTGGSSQGTDRNQVVLDSTELGYGSGAYDIGHVFAVTPNPDGLAASPSLCSNDAKAQGFTGSNTPQGDGFDVDYVAHEIGHQFAMSHTFNNDFDGSCNTRVLDSAYEPASGVTIMGYAGICAPRNLAAGSIEYFNLRSFDQAIGYLQNTVANEFPACGTTTNTGNTPPDAINTGGTVNIPKQTPFTLTASATDANGDALTYFWEEADLTVQMGAPTRSTGAVDTDEDGTARPIFRAYNPSSSGSRTFPSLTYILNNANTPPLTYTGTLPVAPGAGSTSGYVCAPGETCVTGERLPSIARTMNFRVTVRDNNANGGGVRDATKTVVVSGTAGPFQVTAQNSFAEFAPTVTWQAGTPQTVTWDVANTNAAPINTTNVNILLSTDGGLTFPITLTANTPNDGTQTITVPNNPTMTARIKIEAVGNIFFDINNANFAITAPTAASVSVSGRVLSSFGRGVSNAQVSLTGQNGAARTARTNSFGYYRFDDIAAGQTSVFSVSHKRYQFAPRVVTINEELGNFDFAAQQ
jgi:hypothetical protein